MHQQLIFKFPFKTTYDEKDFFVSSNNFEVYKLIESWPNWPNKSINIFGPKGSGKTHLIKILKKRIKIIDYSMKKIENLDSSKIDNSECVVIDNFNEQINEKKLYSFLNHINQLDKFLILSSRVPLKQKKIKLVDLQSRINSFLNVGIDLPTDDLLRVIIVKYFSDKQIKIDLKILEYMIKNVERSYEHVFEILKKIDEHSLSLGHSITIKMVKKFLKNE